MQYYSMQNFSNLSANTNKDTKERIRTFSISASPLPLLESFAWFRRSSGGFWLSSPYWIVSPSSDLLVWSSIPGSVTRVPAASWARKLHLYVTGMGPLFVILTLRVTSVSFTTHPKCTILVSKSMLGKWTTLKRPTVSWNVSWCFDFWRLLQQERVMILDHYDPLF